MNILLLAPQPFYEERGTPIAVDLVLKSLSERGDQVDVVTYHVGRDVHYPNVSLHRMVRIPFIRRIPPGFSMRKVFCDFFFFFAVMRLLLKKHYHLVHAVEESVFIALATKLLFRLPYVYDMDSSLAQQMMERYPRLLKPLTILFNHLEGMAIRHAKAVVPVCDALAHDIEKYSPEKILVLRDVSLLTSSEKSAAVEDLRSALGIEGLMVMYVGNLEAYQGIDLLLESFSLALKKADLASLVVIGGSEADIRHYREMARVLGISDRVHFAGPKPLDLLADYLRQADILVSPRIRGRNTPMKIYSYLDSGRAVLATNLPTHTQVLDDRVAVLADPTPDRFSAGVLRLVQDQKLRETLGKEAKKLVSLHHTIAVFRESLNALYDWLAAEAGGDQPSGPSANLRNLFRLGH